MNGAAIRGHACLITPTVQRQESVDWNEEIEVQASCKGEDKSSCNA